MLSVVPVIADNNKSISAHIYSMFNIIYDPVLGLATYLTFTTAQHSRYHISHFCKWETHTLVLPQTKEQSKQKSRGVQYQWPLLSHQKVWCKQWEHRESRLQTSRSALFHPLWCWLRIGGREGAPDPPYNAVPKLF